MVPELSFSVVPVLSDVDAVSRWILLRVFQLPLASVVKLPSAKLKIGQGPEDPQSKIIERV